MRLADLLEAGRSVEDSFRQVEPRVVDLTTGDYATDVEPSVAEQGQRTRDPLTIVSIPRELDIAVISAIRHLIPDNVRIVVQLTIIASLVIVVDLILKAYAFAVDAVEQIRVLPPNRLSG